MYALFLIFFIGVLLVSSLYNHLRIEHYVKRDVLTHLPNDRVLETDYEKIIKKDKKAQGAVMVLIIKNWGAINNAYGHLNGDAITRLVGKALNSKTRKKIRSYRIWGARFAFLVQDEVEVEGLESIIREIFEALEIPIEVEGAEIHLKGSMGVALYPKDGTKITDLLGKAELSMYPIKDTTTNIFTFFKPTMIEAAKEALQMECKLSVALQKNQFYLCYQPQVGMESFEVIGFEALIRWQEPKQGLIAPDVFIKIAEKTGLIIPIGKWVIEESIEFIKRYNEKYHTHKYVAINISVLQLLKPNFVEELMAIIEGAGVKKEWVELEVTETIPIQAENDVQNLLSQLQKEGIRVALDDFGKGYSNLSYLQNIPVDTLKMDKEFIDGAAYNEKQQVIVNSIIKMCQGLHLQTLAEGVETREQVEYLRSQHCQKLQGYYFSKPVKEEELEERVKYIEQMKV